MTKPIEPRPLSAEERALIEFLLSVEFPGRDELRDQLDRVEVIGICECGCGTVNLNVTGAPVRAATESLIPAEAMAEGLDVLLFARDGLLSSLEFVFYDDNGPEPFPKPSDLRLWMRPAHNPTGSRPPKNST
jgi:hypothetical protein